MAITPKFTPTDTAYTAIGDKIAVCIVQTIDVHIDNAGVTTITNNITHDGNSYQRTDTVCFTSAADCGTYLVANPQA